MRVPSVVGAIALLAGLAAPAGAQRFDWGVSFVGQPGVPTFDTFGASFEEILVSGSFTPAVLTNLADADLSSTFGVRYRGWDRTIALERYKAVAYLATQLPSADQFQQRNIQVAIAMLMGADQTRPVFGARPFGGTGAQSALIQEALARGAGIDADDWTVVSGASADGTEPGEFIVQSVVGGQTVVPEPEVIILLASGLLAIGAVAYLRGFST